MTPLARQETAWPKQASKWRKPARFVGRLFLWFLLALGLYAPFARAAPGSSTRSCHESQFRAAIEGSTPWCRGGARSGLLTGLTFLVIGGGGLRLTRRRRRGRLRPKDPDAHLRVTATGIEVRGRPMKSVLALDAADTAGAFVGTLDLIPAANVPRVLRLHTGPSHPQLIHLVLRRPVRTPPFEAEGWRWQGDRPTRRELERGIDVQIVSFPASEDTELLLWQAKIPVVDDVAAVLVEQFGEADPPTAERRRLAAVRLALLTITARLLVVPMALLPFAITAATSPRPDRSLLVWATVGAAVGTVYSLLWLWRDRRRIGDGELVATGTGGALLAALAVIAAALTSRPSLVALAAASATVVAGAAARHSSTLPERRTSSRPKLGIRSPGWPPPNTTWRVGTSPAVIALAALALLSAVTAYARLGSDDSPHPTPVVEAAIPTQGRAVAAPDESVRTKIIDSVRAHDDATLVPLALATTDQRDVEALKEPGTGWESGVLLADQKGHFRIALEVFDTPEHAAQFHVDQSRRVLAASQPTTGIPTGVPGALAFEAALSSDENGSYLMFLRGRVRIAVQVSTALGERDGVAARLARDVDAALVSA